MAETATAVEDTPLAPADMEAGAEADEGEGVKADEKYCENGGRVDLSGESDA